jgi:hypothetical protein
MENRSSIRIGPTRARPRQPPGPAQAIGGERSPHRTDGITPALNPSLRFTAGAEDQPDTVRLRALHNRELTAMGENMNRPARGMIRRPVCTSLVLAALLSGTAGCAGRAVAHAESQPSSRPLAQSSTQPEAAPTPTPSAPTTVELQDFLAAARSIVPGLSGKPDAALEAAGTTTCTDLRHGMDVFTSMQNASGPTLTLTQAAGLTSVAVGPYGGLCPDQAGKFEAWMEGPGA